MGPLETCQSPTKLVSVQNSVTLGQSPMNIDRGVPKNLGDARGPALWDWGGVAYLKMALHRRIWSF